MSEPVSALDHASYDGLVTVTEMGLQGMITLRGDLDDKTVKSAASAGSGLRQVPARGHASVTGDKGLAWMSPDEMLVLCPYDSVGASLEKMRAKLGTTHALAVDVSDARAQFRVSGDAAREVVAKLCPVDLSPDAFTPGMFRRTRMAQVAAAFWMEPDGSIRVICFRSVAQYVFDLLKVAAQPGSEVGYF